MKRRSFLLLAFIFVLMICMLALASCDDEHVHTFSQDWASDDANHWHAATCEHTDEKSDLAAHDWDAGVETTPATESAKGVKTYTCKVCRKTKTEEIPQLEHQHTYSNTLAYDAGGHYYPSTCGHSDAKKDYTAHDFDDQVTNPTCTEPGYTTHTCDCGYSYQDTPVSPKNHDWEIISSNNDRTHNERCKNDPEHTRENVACDYDVSSTTADCEHGGATVYACDCGHSYTENEVGPLGHQWTIVSHNSDGTHNVVCGRDSSHTDTVDCDYSDVRVVPPTCLEQGYTLHTCACGQFEKTDFVDATDHDWEITGYDEDGKHNVRCKNDPAHVNEVDCDYSDVAVVDPTCTEDGYTRHSCACGQYYDDEPTDATDHDWEIVSSNKNGTHNVKCRNDEKHTDVVNCDYKADEVVSPTCEEDGYTVYKCDCGHSYNADYEDATDHAWGDWTHDDENGGHYRVCRNDASHVETDDCDYDEVATDPTCTEAGYTTCTCTVCEDSYTVDGEPALEHAWGDEWISDEGTHYKVCDNDENHKDVKDCDYETSVTEPTCTERGYTTHTCKDCGYSYNDNYTDAKNHEYSDEWSTDDAHHWHAATCGCDETKDHAAHNFNIKVETVDPSCETDGYTVYKCICGVTKNLDFVERKGHSYGTLLETDREAVEGETCTYLVTYETECSACGKGYKEIKPEEFHSFFTTDKALDHCTASGNSVACEATCQAGGTTHKHCSVVGCKYYSTPKEVTGTPINPDNHVWDNGTSVESTDPETGAVTITTTYTCECGETKKSVTVGAGGGVKVDDNVDEVVIGDTTVTMNGAMKDTVSGGTISSSEKTGDERDGILNDCGVDSELVGSNPVYEFTLNGGNAEFGDGVATITVPFELNGQDPNNIFILYVTEEGENVAIPATYFEKDGQGYLTFSTNHFSYYVPASVSPEKLCEIFGEHSDNVHTVEATCTTGGYDVCLRCGKIIEDSVVGPNGHKFVSTVTKESTCTTDGTVHYDCADCDMAYDITVAATGHYYVLKEHTEASCKQHGRTVQACIYCDNELVVTSPARMHDYFTKTVPSTCTERGYTQKTCTVCGDSTINYVVALGHSFGSTWECAEEGHYHVCTVCGERDKAVAHVPGAPATEENAQVCEECGYVIVPQLAHQHKNMNHYVENEADCTHSGNKEYYVCSCGKWFLDAEGKLLITDHTSVIIDAKGHTNEVIDYLAPTCTEEGHTAGVKCSVCNALLRGNIEIAPTGHTYSKTVTRPTCEDGGHTTYTCSGCGDSYEGDETAPLGHRYIKETINPTCETEGKVTYTCALCADSPKEEVIEALGHSYSSAWSTNDTHHWHECTRCDATDTPVAHVQDYEDATEEHGITCIICRHEIAKAIGHEHSAESTVEYKAPTCAESGNMEYHICRCGEWFYDYACTNKVYSRADVIIPTTGHNLVYHRQINPTCNSEGYTAGYFCTVCDAYISGHVEIPASVEDHKFNIAKYDADGHWYECEQCGTADTKASHVCSEDVTAPTCSMGGYTVFTCNCGYEYVGAFTEPTGHEWGDWVCGYDGTHTRACKTDPRHRQLAMCEYSEEVVAPTCMTRGYTIYTCECGHSYMDSFVKALSHDYRENLVSNNDGTHKAICANDSSHVIEVQCTYASVVTVPTCTEGGYTTYTCDCGHSYTGDFKDPLGHDWTDWDYSDGYHEHYCKNDESHYESFECEYEAEVFEPTCEDSGYTLYTCSVCGSYHEGDYTEPTGHNYGDPRCNYNGTHTYVCQNDRKHTKTVDCEYDYTVTEPTCISGGYTTYTCECGHSYVGDYTQATGHSFGDWEPNGDGTHTRVCQYDVEHTETAKCIYSSFVTAPTCTEQGYTTYNCECGHSFEDNFKAALGHSYGEWESNGDGTHSRVCARDDSHVDTQDCEYDSVVTAPTCTDDGYTTYTCECGHSYVGNHTDALGHSYGDWKSNNDGTHTHVCKNDVNHRETANCTYDAVVTAPTCNKMGYTTYTCECGHTYVGDYTDTTDEHNYVNGTCADCGAKQPVVMKPNEIIVSVEKNGNQVFVNVNVKNMSLAGIRFRLNYNGYIFNMASVSIESDYYDKDGGVNFVWSSGENSIDNDRHMIYVEFGVDATTYGGNIDLEIIEIYEFGEDGELTVPEYSVVYAD